MNEKEILKAIEETKKDIAKIEDLIREFKILVEKYFTYKGYDLDSVNIKIKEQLNQKRIDLAKIRGE